MFLIKLSAAVLCVTLAFSQDVQPEHNDIGLSDQVLDLIGDKLDKQWDEWTVTEEPEAPSDFDEETEKLMKILDYAENVVREAVLDDDESSEADMDGDDDDDDDMLESGRMPHGRRHGRGKGKFSGEDKPGRGGLGQKMARKMARMMKRQRRLHINKLWDLSDVPKRCLNLSEKAEMLCSRVQMVKVHPRLQKIYKVWSKKTSNHGAWNECCNMEDQEMMLTCFKERRMQRQQAMCAKPKPEISKCCGVPDEDKPDCFREHKSRMCNRPVVTDILSVENATEVAPPPSRHHPQQRVTEVREMCCAAGRNESSEEPSPEECSESYLSWSEETDGRRNPACAKSFFGCCMGVKKIRKNLKMVMKTMIATMKGGKSRPRWRKGMKGKPKGRPDGKQNKIREPGQHTRPDKRRHHKRGKGAGRRGKDAARQAAVCCKAGMAETETTVDMCEQKYEAWSEGKTELPSICPDNFVSCCLNDMPKKRKNLNRRGWKNVKTESEEFITFSEESVELPDETGQELEEHMTTTLPTVTWVEPEACCMAGKANLTSSSVGNSVVAVCNTRLSAFARDNDIDNECAESFSRCCRNQMKETRKIKKENKKRRRKPKAPFRPGRVGRKPTRKMPDGLRQDSKGNYFYVDKMPDRVLTARKRNRIARKP